MNRDAESTGNTLNIYAMMAAAAAAVAVTAAAKLDSYDTRPYTPTKQVKYYHTTAFPRDEAPTGDNDGDLGDEFAAYARDLLPTVAVVLGFGLFAFTFLFMWSCGMMKCCRETRSGRSRKRCCGKCCSAPPTVMRKAACNTMAWIFLIGSMVGGFAVLSAAIQSEDELNREFGDFGSVLDVLLEWNTITQADITISVTEIDDLAATTAQLGARSYSHAGIAALCTTASADFDRHTSTARAQLVAVDDLADVLGSSIGNASEDLRDGVDDMNGWRHVYVFIGLLTLLGLICVTTSVTALKQVAPRRCGRSCLLDTIPVLYLLVYLVLVLSVTITYLLVLVWGDFCHDADENFIATTGLGNETFEYYAKCDHLCVNGTALLGLPPQDRCLSAAQAVNPFDAEARAISQVMTDLTTTSASLRSSVAVTCATTIAGLDSSTTPTAAELQADCDFVDVTLKQTVADIVALRDSLLVGESIGPNGELLVVDGLFAQLSCTSLNKRYQAVINQTCKDLYSPLVLLFELTLALCCLMTVVEVLRRLMRPVPPVGTGDAAGGVKAAVEEGRAPSGTSQRAKKARVAPAAVDGGLEQAQRDGFQLERAQNRRGSRNPYSS